MCNLFAHIIPLCFYTHDNRLIYTQSLLIDYRKVYTILDKQSNAKSYSTCTNILGYVRLVLLEKPMKCIPLMGAIVMTRKHCYNLNVY